MNQTRRQFLADVGKGMLIAGIGSSLATDLGVGTVFGAEENERLTFGKLESLVSLLQENAPGKLLPLLVERLNNGTTLADLVSAAALANARTFGGEDYIGFHTLMALPPAYHMAQELPRERQALPVLKVLYRNSNRIQEKGGKTNEVLRPVRAGEEKETLDRGHLREAVRKRDVKKAEQTFFALAQCCPEGALNDLLHTVHDACEVHRVVLVSRAWDLVKHIGDEQAHTLLRQSVRYCVKNEEHSGKSFAGMRTLLPKLLDQHKLAGKQRGEKTVDDAWIDKTCTALFQASAEQAAGMVAEALAEGIEPDAVAEAICLAANQLVLRDSGRPKEQAQPNKPIGSVHGDSIGVHACDSANAWRNIARACNTQNCFTSLILAGYQLGLDRVQRGGEFLKWEPNPRTDALEKVKVTDAASLLREAEGAIKEKNQELVCALVHTYGTQGHETRALLDLLLRYSISEDGALHAEKYYRTTTEEFSNTRKPYRWRQLVALARVTASAYGQPAPGYAEACKLLKV